jgi:hypothetical protein
MQDAVVERVTAIGGPPGQPVQESIMHTTLPSVTRDPAAEFEDARACLQATAAPAVLRVLDTIRIPARIDDRLRGWLGRITSGDSALALDLDEVAQAYRDLSTLYLSCCSYALSPKVPAQAPNHRARHDDRSGRRLRREHGPGLHGTGRPRAARGCRCARHPRRDRPRARATATDLRDGRR